MNARVRLLDFFEQYLDFFCQKNKNTLRAKKADINDFTKFCANFYGLSHSSKLSLQHWNEHVSSRYTDYLERSQVSYATAARRIATLKHVASAMSASYPNFSNPTARIKTPEKRAQSFSFISRSEEQLLRSKATKRIKEKDSFIRLRNRALFELMLGSGLRVEEIRTLKAEQLDEDCTWVAAVRTKAGKFRNIPLSPTASRVLKDYLPKRRDKLSGHTGDIDTTKLAALPLFPSCYKAHLINPESFEMGEKTVWRAINELCNDTKISPHSLRHTYAKRMVEKTSDVEKVQQLMGHCDPRITKQYV